MSITLGVMAGNSMITPRYDATLLFNETFTATPSTLTLTDASGVFTINDDRWKVVGTPAAQSGFLGNSTYTRVNGRALRFSYAHQAVYSAAHRIGWGTAMNSAVTGMALHASASTLQYVTGNHRQIKRAPSDIWSILRTSGHIIASEDKLLFVTDVGTNTNLRPLLWIGAGQQCDFHLDGLAGYTLTAKTGGSWEDLIKVSTVSSPTAPQSGTTKTGNSYIEITWTPGSSEILNIQFRRLDSNNSWVVKCDQTASRIYLYERIAGVETERGGTGGIATTFTVGTPYRIEVVADDQLLTTSVASVKKHEYTAAATQQTQTGVLVSGFTTATNFIIWRRDITGFLPREQFYQDYGAFFVGDSKTAGLPDVTSMVTETLWELSDRDRGRFWERPARSATSGINTATTRANIDAVLAARTDIPKYCIYNLGANDVSAMPVEATWKTNTTYILDAIHTKWPDCQIYMMRVWSRDYVTNCNTLAGWLSDVVATRSSFAHLGPDERIFLENGDNGTTRTSDGIHPNAAGEIATAQAWRVTITGN